MTDLLLALIDEAYDHRSWHGTNLRGAIRGMTLGVAAWRPGTDRHNIWELVVHAAYWKYVVRRRLTGEQRGSFPLAGSNFWRRPTAGTATEWRADLAPARRAASALRAAVSASSRSRLARRAPGSPFTYAGARPWRRRARPLPRRSDSVAEAAGRCVSGAGGGATGTAGTDVIR